MINVLEVMETDERHKQTPADPAYAEGSAYVIDTYVPIAQAAVPLPTVGSCARMPPTTSPPCLAGSFFGSIPTWIDFSTRWQSSSS